MFTFRHPDLGIQLDLRRMGLEERHAQSPLVGQAYDALKVLEAGGVVNESEGRQVGHYWLRAPSMAPPGLAERIRTDRIEMREFGSSIREGGYFQQLLLLGIGGSALGPQLLHHALDLGAGLGFSCIDNTDPEGMFRTLEALDLERTLVVVVSKSGGTAETRNALRATQAAYAERGVDFASHAVVVTIPGSALDREAKDGQWLRCFPQMECVGGRTSVCSTVGLLPATLMGLDTKAFLTGCAEMDAWCRAEEWNPATALAMSWYVQAKEHHRQTLVFLPYKDRLQLCSRYFQQLIMESIGKPGPETGNGLTVYGNKGSTDQHAFVQQLREGVNDFFACFVAVLDKSHDHLLVQGDRTAGDYLISMLLGTRRAFTEASRHSYTVVLPRVDARRLGALIALHERAVGAYASMLGINAYDQPGVEAGKRCAEEFLAIQDRYREGQTLPEGEDFELLKAWIESK